MREREERLRDAESDANGSLRDQVNEAWAKYREVKDEIATLQNQNRMFITENRGVHDQVARLKLDKKELSDENLMLRERIRTLEKSDD
jgi:predicted patatin/cPLA2 family phospholipase